jgi:NADP-dependent 3-hydroxy acid dehydrogenase YdfG
MGEGLRAEVHESDIRTTIIAPGKVDTPFFDDPVEDALQPEDIASAVMYALSQPPHVDVSEVLIRPVHQPG